MLYALSLNPSLDKTVSLPRFDPDAPNRVQVERLDVGGKGVNAARVIRALGGEGTLVGFDYRGRPVAQAMEREGVPAALIPLDGEMRVNMKLRETETGRTLEINEKGPSVTGDDLRRVRDALLERVRPGDWVSLSGSMPPGAPAETYAALCALLAEKGCFAAADCDGPALQAAIQARPALIKPNAQEFSALTGADADNQRETASACMELIEKGVRNICLSLGPKGAMLANAQGVWMCPAADVPVRGTQGAGDSMLGALLLAFERKMNPEEALRFASAAAAASIMRPGTLLCQREDAEALLKALPKAEKVY